MSWDPQCLHQCYINPLPMQFSKKTLLMLFAYISLQGTLEMKHIFPAAAE